MLEGGFSIVGFFGYIVFTTSIQLLAAIQKIMFMAYGARVYRIFIASPSDVEEEREIIARIIREWNDLYSYERKVVLLPLRWETHSAPELGKRPQELINTEIVDHADMAVGVFWTRIGTPTGEYASGTIEEIERLGSAGKIVMCYFSRAKAELDNVDLDQYKRLKEFKKRIYPNGLVESYSNIVEFRDKFAKQLEIRIRTLVAKDSSSDGQLVDTKPNLEFQFINPATKEIIGEKYLAEPTLVSFSKADYDAIPEYERKDGKSDMWSHNKRYYHEFFDYIRDTWSKAPIQFFLKNVSTIAIRDIYIEITCLTDKNFKFSNKRLERPDKSTTFGSSIEFGDVFGNGISRLTLIDGETMNKITLSYSALQPQRNVFIEHPLFITSKQPQDIELSVSIYADCFASPISRKLTISTVPKKVVKKPLEILEEFEIIDK